MMLAKTKQNKLTNSKIKGRNEIKKNGVLLLMMLPGLLYLILFKYMPLTGIIIAFKNYSPRLGIFGSPWVGFKNFEFFIKSSSAWNAIKNTLILNFSFILVNTTVSILIAVFLNEIAQPKFKKLVQSLVILPHFISWVIAGFFVYSFLNYQTGVFGHIQQFLGLEKTDIYSNAKIWPFLFIFINNWKAAGYGSIIYIATIAGINTEYYEAAHIDGATRSQQIRYITVPLLLPTATVMALLSIGSILNSDFGMFYSIVGDNSVLFPTGEVIDTYVFRSLRVLGDVGMSSAVSFIQSVVGFILVLGSNALARRYQEDGALF